MDTSDRTNICEQKEIQSLDFLFLLHQGKRKAKLMMTQIEIFIQVMNYRCIIF